MIEEYTNAGVYAVFQYELVKQLLIRTGIYTVNTQPFVGVGLKFGAFRVDVATAYHPQLGVSPAVMILFNGRKKEKQSLRHYQRNRLNLNSASEIELKDCTFLSPLQIANFLNCRRLLGKFISIYVLQSIPTWHNELMQKIIPFIMVGLALSVREGVLQQKKIRVSNGSKVRNEMALIIIPHIYLFEMLAS